MFSFEESFHQTETFNDAKYTTRIVLLMKGKNGKC